MTLYMAELHTAHYTWRAMGELYELQGLAEHIGPDDVEMLEAAGVPEYGCTCEPDPDTGELYDEDGWPCPHE